MKFLIILMLALCPQTLSDAGIEFIQRYEGYVPVMYMDAVGYWTIGYGHLMNPDEIEDLKGVTLTSDQADELFRVDVEIQEKAVRAYTSVMLLQNQFDALTSFTYNVGSGNFQSSTLRQRVNAERHAEVPEQFLRWDRAGGKRLRGLTLRRQAEANIYANDQDR